ncbi:MAG: DUF2062 domain-containing protein [Gammaproteobacteria bacterium]|jgi:uncharacterized protein (DUF2062 family)
MPRRFLRRFLPKPQELHREKFLRLLGKPLQNPDLWYLNRNSVAGGVSIGLFLAFVPVPFQMLLAAAAAMASGCNLPIAVLMVWVTNPLTIPPLFFAAYKLGAWLLDETPRAIEFSVSFHWLATKLTTVWKPFLLGCLVIGVSSAAVGNATVRIVWRLHVLHRWNARRQRRRRQESTL